MKSLAPGARRLPTHHITIRVPWHDNGWTGSVCARPLENTSCLILPRIGEGKRDEVEARYAGRRLDQMSPGHDGLHSRIYRHDVERNPEIRPDLKFSRLRSWL
jgi:hypothetical protein